MAKRRRIPSWSWAAIPVGLVALAWLALVMIFPLQYRELTNRWELWRGGVTEVQEDGVHALVQDQCQAGASARNCTCVALVHGLADNALTWKKLLLTPAEGWRQKGANKGLKLFAFDLPGSGKSSPPQATSSYRARELARKLAQVMPRLCPSWLVVGNSLGGWVAAWLALDWPQGVDRLVLVSPSGLKDQQAEAGAATAFTEPSVEALKDFQRRAYHKPLEHSDRFWNTVLVHMKSSNARQVREAQTSEDLLDGRLSSLKKPTLVFWGNSDRVLSPLIGRKFATTIPGAIWREVPECGHLPQKECPLPLIQAIAEMVRFGIM